MLVLIFHLPRQVVPTPAGCRLLQIDLASVPPNLSPHLSDAFPWHFPVLEIQPLTAMPLQQVPRKCEKPVFIADPPQLSLVTGEKGGIFEGHHKDRKGARIECQEDERAERARLTHLRLHREFPPLTLVPLNLIAFPTSLQLHQACYVIFISDDRPEPHLDVSNRGFANT